jgi:hypothetical protein
MERHKSSFDLVLSVDALDAIIAFKTAEEETSIKIDQVNHTLELLCRTHMTKDSRALLQVVRADAADEMYRMNLELHQPGTGVRFLDKGSALQAWLDKAGSKLWVYAIPGASKTILSTLAIEKTTKSANATHGVIFTNHNADSSQ